MKHSTKGENGIVVEGTCMINGVVVEKIDAQTLHRLGHREGLDIPTYPSVTSTSNSTTRGSRVVLRTPGLAMLAFRRIWPWGRVKLGFLYRRSIFF